VISDSVPPQTPEPQPAGAGVPVTRTARPRWLLPALSAVIVLAVVIGIVAGFALNATRTGSGASTAASYVPADATIYAELRLDRPGDQAANFETLLGHFPAQAADTLLSDKLDTWLDTAMASDSSGLQYSTDVKPWFDGQLAMAMVGYPSLAGALSGSMTAPPVPDMLFFVGVKDQAAANTAVDKLKAGMTGVTSTSHGSATIWSATAGTGTMSSTVAWTVTSDEVVIGTSVDLVGTALDVHGGSQPALSSRSEFTNGLARLPADRVATVAVDGAAITSSMISDLSSAEPSMAPLFESLSGQAATYMVASARIEGDRLVLDSSAPLPDSSTLANSDRGLAAMTPADAFFFADSPDVGTTLSSFIGSLKEMAASSGFSDPIAQAESILGGDLESFVSWMGDAAIIAGAPSGQPYVGLIIKPTDADQARTKLLQLQGLVTLSTAAGGPAITVSTSDHNRTTITTLTIGGVPADLAWVGSIQYAVTDDRVVFGTGTSLVARILDLSASDSLAGQQRFTDGMSAVGGTSNTQTVWLDLAAIRQALEGAIPGDQKTTYDAQVQPWLAPFDYMASATRVDNGRLEGHAVVVVK
jgi:Protein of unknown function (DUF3352)